MHRLSQKLILAALAVLLFSGVMLVRAHERRAIGGKYDVEVGWGTEPAFINQPNAVTILIYKAGTQDGVTGVEKTLRVKIAFGGNESREFPLQASFSKQGLYTTDIIPTKAGSYIFTFVGEIEGTAVNERFESGPGRFDDVTGVERLQFPQSMPDPLTMATELKTAYEEASSARAFGLIGIVTGVIGVIIGGVALMTRQRA